MTGIDWGVAYNTVFIVGGFVGIIMAIIALLTKTGKKETKKKH